NVTATDNWWGAVDGPGGSGTGSGDEISDNVVISGQSGDDIRTDGSEFVYYNAGGSNHIGYNILTPNVTGTASTEWGSNDAETFLYDVDNRLITADFTGLSNSASYTLLIHYLNKDSGATGQKLVTSNGFDIHEPRQLPDSNASMFSFQVPKQSIDTGNLNLEFKTDTNPRAVVSGIYLLKQNISDSTPPVVQINTPVANSTIGQSNLSISGTATDSESSISQLEVGIQYSGETITWYQVTSLDVSGNWLYNWNTATAGSYLLYARAMDAAGNQHVTSAQNVTVDLQEPGAVTNVQIAQGIGLLSILWTLSVDDSEDVNRYEIFRRTGGVQSFSKVGEVVAGGNRYDDISVDLNTEYFYYVKTVDQTENSADSNTVGPVLRNDDVDTTPPQDVTDFSAQATQINGADISAYLSWTASLDLENDLADQRLSISVDGGTNFGTNAPDYDNDAFTSVGATTNSYLAKNLVANTSYVFKLSVVDEVPNESAGVTTSLTPTGSESEYVSISGNLKDGSIFEAGTYVVTSNLTIAANSTVTLKPGVIVKFKSNTQMTVNGTLLAEGAAGNPVVFTAFSDDSYGGDTNGDGPSTGVPGYWKYIYFSGSASDDSSLSHSVVRYSGSNTGSIYLESSDITIINSTIELGASSGIYSNYSVPVIEGNQVTDHTNEGIAVIRNYSELVPIHNNTVSRNGGHGIYADNSALSIEGNTITDNTYNGIYFSRVEAIDVITGNTITGNNVSMMIPASGFPDQSNTVTPNTKDYIGIRGNAITQDMHLASWSNGTPDQVSKYIVYNAPITVPQYRILTIDPGVIVKFAASTGIDVNGALNAIGTIESRIVFTSVQDDSYGGDTNNNGNATSPVNGDWEGISYNNSLYEQFSRLDHVKIHYAGSADSASLYLNNTDVVIENSEISNSSTNGIRLNNSSSNISGNSIWGNTLDGVRVEGSASNPEITFNRISTNLSDGLEILSSANALATNNQIFLNREFGLRNSTTNIIDATQTWWGDFDSTGPQHATNASGTGNSVSDNVTFAPYQNTAGIEITYSNLSESSGYSEGSLPDSVLTYGTLSDEWDVTNLSPDKTMAWDANTVSVDFSGLDAARYYKLRISYYNGDAADVFQSITDGSGNPVHGSLLVPKTSPAQYEFSIPQNYYNSGNLSLNFVHDNVSTSLRGAVTEYWLVEDTQEFTPPKFEAVEFNDIDGNGSLSLGDEYYFRFSEAMDTSLVTTGTTDANTRLVAEGGLVYGTTNDTRWTTDELTLIVTITDGYTITGEDLISPVGLQDKFSNFSVGSQRLNVTDTITPLFTDLVWVDVDASGYLTPGDKYVFSFNEAMDSNSVADGTTQANALLRPAGGVRYGDLNSVEWSADRTQVTVEVTDGFTIKGNELVTPANFITDNAGNSVTGTQVLTGQDTTAPQIISVSFEDVDGDSILSLGDSYLFTFSEAMNTAALTDNTTEGNQNLSPEGKSYGTTNRITWNTSATEVRVEITNGFTVLGGEVVTPSSSLVDRSGNAVDNTAQLTLIDSTAPTLLSVSGNIESPVRVTNNYRVIVRFNSSMDTVAGTNINISSTGSQSPLVASNGTWTSSVYPNDTYTSPAITLTSSMKGLLSVDISGAQDTFTNTMQTVDGAYQFSLLADPPTITSYPVAPAISYLASTSVLISGERDVDTSIWHDGTELEVIGSGSWNANFTLNEANNEVIIYAKDVNGVASAAVTVKFFVDSIAPVISGVTPTNSSTVNSIVNAIVATFTELGSGLDINNSSMTVTRNGVTVQGGLTSTSTQFTFVPDIEFTEGSYTVSAQLQDQVGHQSAVFNSAFTIDRTPPQAPSLDPAPTVSTINQYQFTGTKEANSAILVNGALSVSNTVETTWSATVSLANGLNALLFTARDQAGNESVATVVTITFDDTAPGAVSITADGVGDGTQVQLGWASYDEVANGN
ncbi:MAG: hypothetical protein GY820_18875, partial [Gammaproteobacteria bacterium]|nr:hypothetical protein [Gammaproteobacteria bacterium]